ncbi:MAG TPA: hypothetical protein VGY99_13625 [Candidatus Binataceae bacterium]|jgi:hypothetical protein|nr:hypothetical protein [Candidatus Binataceae bacterium]
MSLPLSNSGWRIAPFRLPEPLALLALFMFLAFPLALPFFLEMLREELVLDLRAAIVVLILDR